MLTINDTPRVTAIGADHPRRFSIKRDMTNGLFDVWDACRNEYVACDVRRSTAERVIKEARTLGRYSNG